MKKYTLLVTKSTVPVGTAEKIKAVIREELATRERDPFGGLQSRISQGRGRHQGFYESRPGGGRRGKRKCPSVDGKLYRPFLLNNRTILFMDVPSAEMTKYAANAMLATRISFMNDIANLCERTGADVDMVRRGIGSDGRIGSRFLYAGCGYGGSCFPKDVQALIRTGRQYGYDMRVIEAVEAVNRSQKAILFEKVSKVFDGDFRGKKVALWGLSFKPETDDMREAPSLVMIEKLLAAGATVQAYDPIAMPELPPFGRAGGVRSGHVPGGSGVPDD